MNIAPDTNPKIEVESFKNESIDQDEKPYQHNIDKETRRQSELYTTELLENIMKMNDIKFDEKTEEVIEEISE